jgi:hypothetical protein
VVLGKRGIERMIKKRRTVKRRAVWLDKNISV